MGWIRMKTQARRQELKYLIHLVSFLGALAGAGSRNQDSNQHIEVGCGHIKGQLKLFATTSTPWTYPMLNTCSSEPAKKCHAGCIQPVLTDKHDFLCQFVPPTRSIWDAFFHTLSDIWCWRFSHLAKSTAWFFFLLLVLTINVLITTKLRNFLHVYPLSAYILGDAYSTFGWPDFPM